MSGTGASERGEWPDIASHLTFDDVIDDAPFGVVTIDTSSTVVYTNEGVGRILGHDPEALVGESLTVLMPDRFEERHHESFARYRETGERQLDWDAIELPARHADGDEVPLSITFREHEVDGERLFTGVFRDLTQEVERREQLEERTEELTRANEQLERANAELEQFAYVASHDLQEPLRMISSYLDLLELEYGEELDAEALEYIDYAVDGAERMREMIEDLLTYSRLQRREERFEPVDVAAVVERVCTDLSVAIEEADANVVYGDLPTVTADEHRLRRLFQNLVENAVEHGSTGSRTGSDDDVEHGGEAPTVRICHEEREASHVFRVSDDGPGIPEGERDEVFDVFRQGADAEGGSGIGLAICDRVAAAHDGDIRVDSTVGEGTTFTVELSKAPADD